MTRDEFNALALTVELLHGVEQNLRLVDHPLARKNVERARDMRFDAETMRRVSAARLHSPHVVGNRGGW